MTNEPSFLIIDVFCFFFVTKPTDNRTNIHHDLKTLVGQFLKTQKAHTTLKVQTISPRPYPILFWKRYRKTYPPHSTILEPNRSCPYCPYNLTEFGGRITGEANIWQKSSQTQDIQLNIRKNQPQLTKAVEIKVFNFPKYKTFFIECFRNKN